MLLTGCTGIGPYDALRFGLSATHTVATRELTLVCRKILSMNATDNATTIANSTATDTVKPSMLFKVGWNYGTYLSKNNLPPSEHNQLEWLALSRKASKEQVELIASLSASGMKTKCTKRAVFNARDGRFDTSLTARVVQPGCDDPDLIQDTILAAQKRASDRLSDMRATARKLGVL